MVRMQALQSVILREEQMKKRTLFPSTSQYNFSVPFPHPSRNLVGKCRGFLKMIPGHLHPSGRIAMLPGIITIPLLNGIFPTQHSWERTPRCTEFGHNIEDDSINDLCSWKGREYTFLNYRECSPSPLSPNHCLPELFFLFRLFES